MTLAVVPEAQGIDPAQYRQIFGLLPTGVVAITGKNTADQPTGFVVGTFQSLSLDPPLVTFCVDKSSSSWPALRSLGKFTANILSTNQLPICRALSRKGTEKFQGVNYNLSPLDTPRIHGAVAWLDCEVLSEVVAGDHYMVVGAIDTMTEGTGDALLFRGGKFGDFNLRPIENTHKGAAR